MRVCPGAGDRGHRKNCHPLRGTGRAKAPPALPLFPAVLLILLYVLRLSRFIIVFLTVLSPVLLIIIPVDILALTIIRKKGRAMAPFGS